MTSKSTVGNYCKTAGYDVASGNHNYSSQGDLVHEGGGQAVDAAIC